MASPGDLCLIQDLKLYLGGAAITDTASDALLSNLVSAASAFIARYLDRDVMTLGGQGNATIAGVGVDSGGNFITLSSSLPSVPSVGAMVADRQSLAASAVVAPAGNAANTTSKLYLASTVTFAIDDPVNVAMLALFTEVCDGSGKPWQGLHHWPIASVDSVTDLPSGRPYSLSSIVADPDLPRLLYQLPAGTSPGPLTYSTQPGVFAAGRQNLQVVYRAGYLAVPFDLAQAACELAALWFRNRDRIGVSAEAILGTRVDFFGNSDLLPQTRLKLQPFRRTIRGF